MPKNKMSIEFDGFAEVIDKLTKLNADTKKITEDALIKTHTIVTGKAEAAIAKPNLPAGGKYSTGDTLNSLLRQPKVEWVGSVGKVSVGFEGNVTSIFLMYGTPRVKKVKKLYDAFYGVLTRNIIKEAQETIFYKAIRELE